MAPSDGRRASGAAADIGAAQTSQVAQAREVRLNTALAWIDLFYAERRLAALDDIDKALAPLRAAAPSQLASGAMRAAQTEPEQLTAVLGDRRADLVAAVAKARSELARWTGDVDAKVAGDPPDFPIDAAALHAGLDQLPVLAVYDAMGRQADADVDLAKADKRSDWGWELAYQHRDPRFGDMVMVQASVSLPLFASTRQDPIIAARTETAGRIRIEREAARRTPWPRWMRASPTTPCTTTVCTGRLRPSCPRQAPRRPGNRRGYAAGTATLSDVLQAFLALADHIDAINRDADVARDSARIFLTYGSDAQ